MADVLQRILTEFIRFSPFLYPVKLQEDSYPLIGTSFSGTQFMMDYYEAPEKRGVVSKLIYVSSKVRYVYVSSKCSLPHNLVQPSCVGEVVVPFTRHNFV